MVRFRSLWNICALRSTRRYKLFLLHPNLLPPMHQYSYYLVPVYPYTQTLIPLPNSQPLPMQLTLPAQNNIQTSLLQHQNDHNCQVYKPASTDDPDQRSNQEPQHHSANNSLRPHQTTPLSRGSSAQSFVVDHNIYKYPKKNAQSNLINQIFSYISIPSKSSHEVLSLFSQDHGKTQLYYEIMRNLKRQNKKYINRGYLKDLLLMERSHIIHGILQKIKIEIDISQEELKMVLRRIVVAFLREKCTLTILTSSKLDRFALREHLQRRRDVLEYLIYHLRVSVQAK